MRIPRVFQNNEFIEYQKFELSTDAFQRVIKVLRLQTDNELIIFNGKGQVCTATISSIEKKTCYVKLNSLQVFQPPRFNLCLIQVIIKPDKMDLIIQKAVELGVTKIIPVISKHCDIKINRDFIEKKQQHWQKIIIGACEQCGANYLPNLLPVQSLVDCIKSHPVQSGIVLDPYANKSFADLPKELNELSLIIGPEGGLTADEISFAIEYNFTAIQLGKRVLRAETAAIASLVLSQWHYGDF